MSQFHSVSVRIPDQSTSETAQESYKKARKQNFETRQTWTWTTINMSSQQYWDQVDENILIEYLKQETKEEMEANDSEFGSSFCSYLIG